MMQQETATTIEYFWPPKTQSDKFFNLINSLWERGGGETQGHVK